MSAESDPVSDIFEAYSSAVLAKDLDTFLDLYAPDALIFDSWGYWQAAGIEQWRERVTMWFDSLGEQLCQARFSDVVATVRDDVAFAHAAVRYSEVTPDGVETNFMMNRMTVTLAKADGVWRITHEHTSMPLDMESATGLFDAYEKRHEL